MLISKRVVHVNGIFGTESDVRNAHYCAQSEQHKKSVPHGDGVSSTMNQMGRCAGCVVTRKGA